MDGLSCVWLRHGHEHEHAIGRGHNGGEKPPHNLNQADADTDNQISWNASDMYP